MKPNKETAKILSDGQKIEDFVKSDGWKLARKMLYDKLITLDSIASVPKTGLTDEQKLREYDVREGVVAIILEWIKEVEGSAEQNQSNKDLMKDIRKESIIQYF